MSCKANHLPKPHDNKMLSSIEKTLLKELLALAPVPEQTLSYNELMGFMFGLAITPVTIPDDEWMVAIFGDDDSGITAEDQARSLSTVLSQVYTTFMVKKSRHELHFPYQLENLEQNELEEVLEWVSGFEEALALRPEIWEPADESELEARSIEELFFSMMVIQGLVDPIDVMPFFEKLPDELMAEAFTTLTPGEENKDLQIQLFLLSTLPLAVQTLQKHADKLEQDMALKEKFRFVSTAQAKRTMPVTSKTDVTEKTTRKANIIKVDFTKKTKITSKKPKLPIYQLKISLKGSRPPIWRRIQVPGSVTLAELHDIIQISMGWFDSHLHQFNIKRTLYGPVTDDDWAMERMNDEVQYTLDSLSEEIQPHFEYIYDFGDDWQHRITVETVLKPEEGKPYPVLLTGKRACPPEDIGGIWGYQEFLEAYADPDHDDHEAMVEWAGNDILPDLFDDEDISEINEILKNMFN
jgi:yecA family protein